MNTQDKYPLAVLNTQIMSATEEAGNVLTILGWEKNIRHYVLDPIYGPIGVTDLEFDLIKSSEVFARLKNIRQLGFVSHIYPSATHTRFEHSVGTLAITWKMLERILKRLEENSESSIIRLFTNNVIKSFRLAALLHDLGHGPFSHSMEEALGYLGISFDHDELTSYLLSFKLSKESIDSIRPSFNTKNKKLRRFRRELAHKLTPELRRLILAIQDLKFNSSLIPRGFERIRFLLHDMLKGDIGSDRIDYLLRDTYFTGLGHRFSLSEILDNLYYIYDKVNNHSILAIKSEGKAAVELMLLTRYFHYQFIAHHPKNVMLTAILQRRMKSYLEKMNANIKRKERERVLVDIALSNDWIESDLSDSENIFPFHRVTLLDFKNFVSRFLFYRVIEDPVLRSAFQGEIENYILEKHGINVREKLLFNFTVGKPRVPIMHYYMDRYTIGTVKQSALFHDHSPFLLGLGRAYIGNSSMTIYTESELKSGLKKVFDTDPDFYKETSFLEGIVRKVTPNSLHIHDYLLFILFILGHRSKDRTIKGYKQVTNEFKRIRRGLQPEYDYSTYEKCYDHETNSTFDCPSRVFNALILFDVCKFINIELVTYLSKKAAGEQFFKPSYDIKVRRHPWAKRPGMYFIPLHLTIKRYPQMIAQLFM